MDGKVLVWIHIFVSATAIKIGLIDAVSQEVRATDFGSSQPHRPQSGHGTAFDQVIGGDVRIGRRGENRFTAGFRPVASSNMAENSLEDRGIECLLRVIVGL